MYLRLHLNFKVQQIDKFIGENKSGFDLGVEYDSIDVVDIGSRLVFCSKEFAESNKDTIGHAKGKREPVHYSFQIIKNDDEGIKNSITLEDNRHTKSGFLKFLIYLKTDQFFEFERSLSNGARLDGVYIGVKNHDFIQKKSYLDHRSLWDCDFIRNRVLDIDYFNFTFNFQSDKAINPHQNNDSSMTRPYTEDHSSSKFQLGEANNEYFELKKIIKSYSEYLETNIRLMRYLLLAVSIICLLNLFK